MDFSMIIPTFRGVRAYAKHQGRRPTRKIRQHKISHCESTELLAVGSTDTEKDHQPQSEQNHPG
jgi:hypothetical protein